MEATLLVGRIQENLGTEWSSPYSLSRFAPHLCQSIAREQRADEKIQEWLGHNEFSTTANIYAHLDYQSKISSAEAMLTGLDMG